MKHSYDMDLAGRPLSLETGELAQQAGGAVTLRYGDTMLLAALSPPATLGAGSISSRSRWTLRRSCTPPGASPAPSSAARAGRLLRPYSRRGSRTGRFGRSSQRATWMTPRSSSPCSPTDMGSPHRHAWVPSSRQRCADASPTCPGTARSLRCAIGHVDGELVLQPSWAEQIDTKVTSASSWPGLQGRDHDGGGRGRRGAGVSCSIDAMELGQEAIRDHRRVTRADAGGLGEAREARLHRQAQRRHRGAVATIEAERSPTISKRRSRPDSGLTKAERDTKRDELRCWAKLTRH